MTAAAHRREAPFSPYSRAEYLADAFVHVAGVIAGVAAGVWLIATMWHSAPGIVLSLAAYAMGMIGMLLSSAAYNLTSNCLLKSRLRRFDHASIFLAIAGSYTPLLTRLPSWHSAAVSLVWGIAAAGVILKLFAPGRYERAGLALYLGLGWIGLPLAPTLAGHLRHGTASLIVLGLSIYTLGVGAYLAKRLRYHNVLWHAMVLAAAGCHFTAMMTEFCP